MGKGCGWPCALARHFDVALRTICHCSAELVGLSASMLGFYDHHFGLVSSFFPLFENSLRPAKQRISYVKGCEFLTRTQSHKSQVT